MAAGRGNGYRLLTWIVGTVGAVTTFLGLFILLAGDDQYVGLGGRASWRIGDIQPGWGYGLLAAGIALLLVGAAFYMLARRALEEHVRRSASTDLVTHAAVFLVVNAFLWIQDIAAGSGLNYAYWITIPWGLGLAAHALAYFSRARRQAR